MSRAGTFLGEETSAEQVFLYAAAALFVWQLSWIWISWPYMLDDALIHLHYAENLRRYHRITFDGVHASFGTSSLLYVSLLAFLGAAWNSPLLPRAVSSVVYVALFLALFATLYRALRAGPNVPSKVWLMALALLAVIVAPSAARWLNDGMETGLVFLDALAGVVLLRRMLRLPRGSVLLGVAAFAYGFFTVLLRVELAVLVVVLTVMGCFELCHDKVKSGWGHLLPVLALFAGALAAGGLIFGTMHALLPDTAHAKAFGPHEWLSTFQTTVKTMLGSASFGIGLVVLWLLVLGVLLIERRTRWADWIANSLFPVMLVVSAARGQQIFFIRYFGWAVFFSLLWSLLRFPTLPFRERRDFLRPLLLVFLLALVPAFVWESWAFYRVFAQRNAAFHQFRSQHLDALRGQPGIAEDVGFVGYFTQGDICDPYGLINGREAAMLDYSRRFSNCMALHPVFAFGGKDFLQKVTANRTLAGWSVCGSYNFRNVKSDDVHYLVVAPLLAASVCAGRETPVAQAVPGLL